MSRPSSSAGAAPDFRDRILKAIGQIDASASYVNVNGLPEEGQVTTARDLAKLARAIIIEFPEHADVFSTVQVQVGDHVIRSHNGMLVSFPGADGMKTGYIASATIVVAQLGAVHCASWVTLFSNS
jgi:D-alanyl-D-alanine carboxypeptidase